MPFQLNSRQRFGIGMIISGLVSAGVGILVNVFPVTPAWVKIVVDTLSFLLPSMGVVVNLPSNTDPQ